jgi:hypothetical protein
MIEQASGSALASDKSNDIAHSLAPAASAT